MKMEIILVLTAVQLACGVIHRLNETEYKKLPALYELDDFYPCLQSTGDLYCYVDALLVANTTSELLNVIKEYSEDTIAHFNHSVVHRGVCVTQTCRQYLGNSTNINEALEECLNATLYKSHGLQVNVIKNQVECTHYNEKVDIDVADCAVAAIMATLVLLTTLGSAMDSKLSNSKHFGARILLCFSLKKNWQRLTQPSGEGPEPRMERLKSLNGIKTLTTMLVILGHTPIGALFNTNNPEFLEMSYRNPLYSILYGGPLIVQTFFIISGFLLVYNTLLVEEKTKFNWRMLPKGVMLRWLRLTPPYAAILAVISTWFRHLGNGPLWKTVVGVEIKDCRSHWYKHMLYINNYFDYSHCMTHSWYLASDMQLSVLGLLVFCLASGARARKMAVGVAIAIGLLTPAIHIYVQDLYPILMTAPEVLRHFIAEDLTFNNLYKRGHNNLICYAIGLGLAMLVYRLQKKNIDVEKYKKYRPLYWATFPMMLLVVSTASIFYIDGLYVPVGFRIAYSSALKLFYSLIFTTILLGTIFKFEKIYRSVLEWRGWAAPSRISYSAYLLHVSITRYLLADHTSLVHSSEYLIIEHYLGVMATSFLLAVPLWMIVEAPCGQLVKVCLTPNSRKPESNHETKKSVTLSTQITVIGSKETEEIKP